VLDDGTRIHARGGDRERRSPGDAAPAGCPRRPGLARRCRGRPDARLHRQGHPGAVAPARFGPPRHHRAPPPPSSTRRSPTSSGATGSPRAAGASSPSGCGPRTTCRPRSTRRSPRGQAPAERVRPVRPLPPRRRVGRAPWTRWPARDRLDRPVLPTGSRTRSSHVEVLGPPDIEREVGLTGGHIFQGECLPDAHVGPSAVRRHTDGGVYLCGAGTYPGGSVMAVNGRNAAWRSWPTREALRSAGGDGQPHGRTREGLVGVLLHVQLAADPPSSVRSRVEHEGLALAHQRAGPLGAERRETVPSGSASSG
jgi:hypothetical protein